MPWITGLVAALLMLLAAPAHAEESSWEQLRTEDGLVVLLRHALAPGTGDPPGFRLGDCATQRNLSSEGRAQARSLGREFQRQRVPVTEVRSSRWCRARDTARLMDLGPVRATPALDSAFTASARQAEKHRVATERIIRDHRGRDGVLVLVGHQVNITDVTGIAPREGEGVVVRADSDGQVMVVGTIHGPTPREPISTASVG